MQLQTPQSETNRLEFLEQFLHGTRQPENSTLITSSMTTDFETTKTAYQTAIETRSTRLAERVRLVQERKQATDQLRLMIRQTLTNLRLMIRRGTYPESILRAFNIPIVGYKPPKRINLQVPTAENLIRGDQALGEQKLPRLASPRAQEIQTAIDLARSKTQELTGIKEFLRLARQEVHLIQEEIKRLFYQGQRALDLKTAQKTEAQKRELKRNFGYRWKATRQEDETENNETTEDNTETSETPEETPTEGDNTTEG